MLFLHHILVTSIRKRIEGLGSNKKKQHKTKLLWSLKVTMSAEGNLPFFCVAETKSDHIIISLLFPRPVQKPCCCSHGRPEKQRQLPNHLTPLSSKSGDLTHLHAAALGCLSAGDRQWCNYCFKPTGRWLTGSWAAAERIAWSEEVSSRRRKEDRNGQKMPQVQGMDKNDI